MAIEIWVMAIFAINLGAKNVEEKNNMTAEQEKQCHAIIHTHAVAAGAGFLSKGKGLLGLVAWVSGLMSLGLWYNHHNMKKNNVDALQYTA